jgi:hypothetical protein
MKTIQCLFILSLLLISGLHAQDKIITLQLDTIECKITSIDQEKLTFEIDSKGIITIGTYLQSQIKAVQLSPESMNRISSKNIKKQTDRTEEKKQNEQEAFILEQPVKRFKLRAQTGYGSLIASSTEAMYSLMAIGFDHASASQYYKKLRHTLINSFSAQYQLFAYHGYQLSMCFIYQNMFNQSKVSSSTIDVGDGIHLINGSFQESIYSNYYAYSVRQDFVLGSKQRSSIFLEGGTGLTTYRNHLVLAKSPVLIQGFAPGYYSQLGYTLHLKPALSFEIMGGFFASVLKGMKVSTAQSSQYTELNSEQYESLARVYIKTGLTYHF